MNPSALSRGTILCRCEDLTVGDIEDAIARGARTMNDVKRRTRMGMGLCQGTICAMYVRQMIADRTGQPIASIRPATIRAPMRPIPIAMLMAEPEEAASDG